ncbi:MAG: hypothetical protein IPP51_05155 [Bacteroidetes bacterium]|nr:hypothetical protein [Bacteroidota bacterium]
MKKIAALITVAALVYSCSSDNLEDLHPIAATCDTAAVSFANDILPIMQTQCGTNDNSCHQTDMSSGGYGLADYQSVFNSIDYTDNDFEPGAFVKCIKHEPVAGGGTDMPKNAAKLDDCSINKIVAWINQGRLNN